MLNFSEANGTGWTAWPLTPLTLPCSRNILPPHWLAYFPPIFDEHNTCSCILAGYLKGEQLKILHYLEKFQKLSHATRSYVVAWDGKCHSWTTKCHLLPPQGICLKLFIVILSLQLRRYLKLWLSSDFIIVAY